MSKVRTIQVVYVVECVEYEAGWGSKPDGYVLFAEESEARSWVQAQYGDRAGPTPSYYVNYDCIGYQEAGPKTVAKLEGSASGRIYIDRLSEITQ
jgi:hypothetical protein